MVRRVLLLLGLVMGTCMGTTHIEKYIVNEAVSPLADINCEAGHLWEVTGGCTCDDSVEEVTIQVTSGYDKLTDVLDCSECGVATFDANTGKLTLMNEATTLTDWSTKLATMTFTTTTITPVFKELTITATIPDCGGGATGKVLLIDSGIVVEIEAVPAQVQGDGTIAFQATLVFKNADDTGDLIMETNAAASWDVGGSMYMGFDLNIVESIPMDDSTDLPEFVATATLTCDLGTIAVQRPLPLYDVNPDIVDAVDICETIVSPCIEGENTIADPCVVKMSAQGTAYVGMVMKTDCGVQKIESIDVMTWVATLVDALPEEVFRFLDTDGFVPSDEDEPAPAGHRTARTLANPKWSLKASGNAAAGVSVKPFLTMRAGIAFRIRISWFRLKEVKAIARGSIELGVEVTISASASASITAEVTLLNNKRLFSIRFFVGPVPVVLTVHGSLAVGITLTGNVKASLMVRPAVGGSASFGIHWVRGQGFRKANGLSVGFKAGVETALEAQCDITLRPFIKPGLEIRLYGAYPRASVTLDFGLPMKRQFPAPNTPALKGKCPCLPEGSSGNYYDTISWDLKGSVVINVLVAKVTVKLGPYGNLIWENCDSVEGTTCGVCGCEDCPCDPKCDTTAPQPPSTPLPGLPPLTLEPPFKPTEIAPTPHPPTPVPRTPVPPTKAPPTGVPLTGTPRTEPPATDPPKTPAPPTDAPQTGSPGGGGGPGGCVPASLDGIPLEPGAVPPPLERIPAVLSGATRLAVSMPVSQGSVFTFQCCVPGPCVAFFVIYNCRDCNTGRQGGIPGSPGWYRHRCNPFIPSDDLHHPTYLLSRVVLPDEPVQVMLTDPLALSAVYYQESLPPPCPPFIGPSDKPGVCPLPCL